MTTSNSEILSVLDDIDEQIVGAIQVSPRASFREICEALEIPEQMVARRYRRLRRDGLLRVTLALNPRAFGGTVQLVSVRCRPEAAESIATTMSADEHVSWTSIHSAGWGIVCYLRAHSGADAHRRLNRLVPRTAAVHSVSTATVLHIFAGGNSDDWQHWQGALTPAQVEYLTRTNAFPAAPVNLTTAHPAAVNPTAADRPILEHLSRDGRLPMATLARTTGSTTGKVTRRVHALVDSGVAFFDVDLAEAVTGGLLAKLSMRVAPERVHAAGLALSQHIDVPFAAATTGPWNLTATIMAGDEAALYTFATSTLGDIEGLTDHELIIMDRRVKNAGALIAGDRLAPPTIAGY